MELDTADGNPRSFMEIFEEETGLNQPFLTLLFAAYAFAAIVLLIAGVWGIYLRLFAARQSSRKTILKTDPAYKSVKTSGSNDSRTKNVDENYV